MKCPDCGGDLRDAIEDFENPAYRWRCKECFTYWCDTELEEEKKWRERNDKRKT